MRGGGVGWWKGENEGVQGMMVPCTLSFPSPLVKAAQKRRLYRRDGELFTIRL